VFGKHRREPADVNLARLMLVMVDIVLAGDPLGLETGRDLIREASTHSLNWWQSVVPVIELLRTGWCSLTR
jgi:hypothetical protein